MSKRLSVNGGDRRLDKWKCAVCGQENVPHKRTGAPWEPHRRSRRHRDALTAKAAP